MPFDTKSRHLVFFSATFFHDEIRLYFPKIPMFGDALLALISVYSMHFIFNSCIIRLDQWSSELGSISAFEQDLILNVPDSHFHLPSDHTEFHIRLHIFAPDCRFVFLLSFCHYCHCIRYLIEISSQNSNLSITKFDTMCLVVNCRCFICLCWTAMAKLGKAWSGKTFVIDGWWTKISTWKIKDCWGRSW